MEKKIAELKSQIQKAEVDDLPQEREVELLKRRSVKETEKAKWEALREVGPLPSLCGLPSHTPQYGEKLVLLAQAADPIISALPVFPPSPETPYRGAQATGAARASLQRALDNYKTGHINLPTPLEGSDLSRFDTRSFGESHASELSSLDSTDISQVTQPGIPLTPPAVHNVPLPAAHSDTSQSKPIDPSHLNLAPVSIPPSTTSPATSPPAPVAFRDSESHVPDAPTIAETGVPVSAGASGPGPSSGSLRDIHRATPTTAATKWESAEEEKKRLQGYSQVYTPPGGAQPVQPSSTTQAPESAEDEKKRLEREERERVLQANTAKDEKKDEDLPPYQDM